MTDDGGFRYERKVGRKHAFGQSGWNHGNVRRSRPFWDECAFIF